MRVFSIVRSKKIVLLALLTAIISICLALTYSLNKRRDKVLLIGLDGASWKLIIPLIKEGKLPVIKHLVEEGCWGRLGTLKVLISEVIWTTVITGKSPELHGIVGNLMVDPDTKELVPITSNLRKVRAIWNILGDYRKKVGVVGYRASWPAEKVNGFMISDWHGSGDYSSPQYAQPPLNSFCTEEMFRNFGRNSPDFQLREDTDWIFRLDSFMANAAEYLYTNNKFDFFCLYLAGIDGASHYYWKYMFPDNQDIPPEEVSKYKDVILSYYIWCDTFIGRLLRGADNNTTVIIISDHGFMTKDPRCPKYIFSEVNLLLQAAGLKKFIYNSKEVELINTISEMSGEFRKNIRIGGNISGEEFNVVRQKAKNVLTSIKVKEDGGYLFRIFDDTQNGFIFEMDASYAQDKGYHILIGEKEYRILDFLTKDAFSGQHDPNYAVIIMFGKNIR